MSGARIEASKTDWNDSESVVMAAVPNAVIVWSEGCQCWFVMAGDMACEYGRDEQRPNAIIKARQHPAVQAFEKAKRPADAEGTSKPSFHVAPAEGESQPEPKVANFLQQVGRVSCVRCEWKSEETSPEEMNRQLHDHLDYSHPGWLADSVAETSRGTYIAKPVALEPLEFYVHGYPNCDCDLVGGDNDCAIRPSYQTPLQQRERQLSEALATLRYAQDEVVNLRLSHQATVERLTRERDALHEAATDVLSIVGEHNPQHPDLLEFNECPEDHPLCCGFCETLHNLRKALAPGKEGGPA